MSRHLSVAKLTILTFLARSTHGFSTTSTLKRCTTSVVPVSTALFDINYNNRMMQHSRRFMSSGDSSGEITLTNIGKEEMEEILDDLEEGGREESGYVVMDVRGEEEVAMTGKLSPAVYTLPLPLIMQLNIFALDEDDFEEVCGFAKPQPDETLVFSCAAGIRSVQAARFAAMAGYSNLVNYKGGANEFFYT